MERLCFDMNGKLISISISAVVALASIALPVQKKPAEPTFKKDVAPFAKKFCEKCHSGANPADGFSIPKLDEKEVTKESKAWKKMGRNVFRHKMPPKNFELQPTAAESKKFVDWIDAKFAEPTKK